MPADERGYVITPAALVEGALKFELTVVQRDAINRTVWRHFVHRTKALAAVRAVTQPLRVYASLAEKGYAPVLENDAGSADLVALCDEVEQSVAFISDVGRRATKRAPRRGS